MKYLVFLVSLAAAVSLACLVLLVSCTSTIREGGQRHAGAATPTPSPVDPLVQTDELWILGREDGATQRPRQEDGYFLLPEEEAPRAPGEIPGGGGLVSTDPITGKTVPVPLEHTSVRGEVRGTLATVDVAQRFTNPFDTKIEAVYVFPLPDDAAVHDFVMTIGERKIRGIVREREEAERIYAQARAQGYVASLLTEERPNVFTQKLANLEPGHSIDIAIRYFDLLPLVDGWYEFVFPMVVGPRFNPPGSNAGIGAVARGAKSGSGQKNDVSYLAPGERSGHDIALELDLDAGTPIEAWECKTHRVEAREDGERGLRVALAADDRIPNRDFVLRYRVAGESLRTALITGHDERGEYFALTLHPPALLEDAQREPIELVFLLDTSGSMDGKPMELSRRAMRRALAMLDPRDSFQILRFSDQASGFAPAALPATEENLGRARSYVEALDADGGTMMIEGLRAALGAPRDPERRRIVALLSDGYVGNETEILAEERRLLGDARVFGFGVGSSVNRYLMETMSSEGHGVSAYVGLSDEAEEVMASFLERLRRPALEEIHLAGAGLERVELYPARIPDLFPGRPITIVGRLPAASDAAPSSIEVSGSVAGRALRIPVEFALGHAEATALPWIWARARIAALSSRALDAEAGLRAELSGEIRSTALEYGLSSAFTAFVAVDSSQKTAGDHGVTVPVAVPVPDGVRYDTTVAAPGG